MLRSLPNLPTTPLLRFLVSSVVNLILKYRGYPTRFIKEMILRPGQVMTKGQIKICDAFEKVKRLYISAGHGVGKTVLVAWLAIYFFHCYHRALIPVTAPTMHQLHDVFGANVKMWYDQSKLKSLGLMRFKSGNYGIDDDLLFERWAIKLLASSVPENLQGLHERNMFAIVDEASGVNEKALEVLEGALNTANCYLIVIGNPTKNSGMMYDAFHKHKVYNEGHLFFMSCEDDEREEVIKYCADMAAKYGVNSNVYKIRVKGEFGKTSTSAVFQAYILENALNNKGEFDHTMTLGFDPGAGGDLSVVFERIGKQVTNIYEFDFKDTELLCDEIEKIVLINQNRYNVVINMDSTGLGWPIYCGLNRRINEKKFSCQINVVNFAESPLKPQMYVDRPTELYFEASDKLASLEYGVRDTESGDLFAQLTGREFGHVGNIMQIESKKAYKKRNQGESPNHSDAFVLCMADSFKRLAVGA